MPLQCREAAQDGSAIGPWVPVVNIAVEDIAVVRVAVVRVAVVRVAVVMVAVVYGYTYVRQ
jgi:hypothetical protein